MLLGEAVPSEIGSPSDALNMADKIATTALIEIGGSQDDKVLSSLTRRIMMIATKLAALPTRDSSSHFQSIRLAARR